MIFKISAIAVITAILALGLKKTNENYAVLVLIAGGIAASAFIVSALINAAGDMSELFSYTGADSTYLKILLKCLGISLITEFAANICEDASYKALSGQILLAGKVAVLAVSLPVFKAVLEMCIGLIKR